MPTSKGPVTRKFVRVMVMNMKRKLDSFHKYRIPAAIEAHTDSAAVCSLCWRAPRINHKVNAETAKLTASTVKAKALPVGDLAYLAMIMPAIVGPMKEISCAV